MADELTARKDLLIRENARDLAAAREQGLSKAMIDRLTLTEATIAGIARGLREVAALPDPTGRITSMERRPNGLLVGRMRIPLGVIGIIYESGRTSPPTGVLCLNRQCRDLRGGSEAIHSNLAIGAILQEISGIWP
jgi:glutamate-5-semialdehyde dehydrogenase